MKRIEKDIVISELLYQSLHGKLSEDEQSMLGCWLQDEANKEFYASLQEVEVLYEGMREMAELDTSLYYRKLQQKINRKRNLRLWLTVSGVAAALIPAIWLWSPLMKSDQPAIPPFTIVQQLPEDCNILQTVEGKTYFLDDTVKQIQQEEVVEKEIPGIEYIKVEPSKKATVYNVLATSSRGMIQVTLADSSRVWLNAGSRLRYPNEFDGNQREVELKGEAYFEVAHNARKPFIVKTGLAQIKVLGTQFNVNTQDGKNCVTTLVQGCVKVQNSVRDSVVIWSGQQVCASKVGGMTVKSVDPRYYTAWKRDRFAFQDQELWRIMEELSAWYGITFEFSDVRLANLQLTTIVPRYPEIRDVLSILQMTESFSFVQLENGHVRIMGYGE